MPPLTSPVDRSRLRLGIIALLALAVASCASRLPGPSTATATMDIALDLGGQAMFYHGTAQIPRGFGSATPFEMGFDLARWGQPSGGEGAIGPAAEAMLGKAFKGRGTYQPLPDGNGVVSLKSGRLLLRGAVDKNGLVLDGDWFLDGKLGGGFRIAGKGTIFP